MRQLPGNGGGFLETLRGLAATVVTVAGLVFLVVLLWPVLTFLALVLLGVLVVGLVTLLIFAWRVRREFRRQMSEWERRQREAEEEAEEEAGEKPEDEGAWQRRRGHRAKHVDSRVRDDE